MAAPPISLAPFRVARGVRRWYAFAFHAFFCVPPSCAAGADRPAVGHAAALAHRGRTRWLARGLRRTVAPPRRERRRKEAGADPAADPRRGPRSFEANWRLAALYNWEADAKERSEEH